MQKPEARCQMRAEAQRMIEALPKDREELRQALMERCRERIANGQRVKNEAWKERDWEGVALAQHSIGQSTRFLAKLEREAPQPSTLNFLTINF